MNAKGKHIDKTFLSIDNAEDRGFIHRDYIAHCLRWSHVVKRLYERRCWQTAKILDIGCGRELPFAKMLYSSKLIPAAYTGVDVGPVNDDDQAKLKGEMARISMIFQNENFLDVTMADLGRGGPATIVTCFEVLEHVEPKMMIDMLEHMKALTTDDARFFISTPNWNVVSCADNHVNEMKYHALGATLERHGFHVENVYGTFASIRDYEHKLPDVPAVYGAWSPRQLFDKLREYYDTNFLSCVFAPLFPAESRNALWELRKRDFFKPEPSKKFEPIETVETPWSSSMHWEDMAL